MSKDAETRKQIEGMTQRIVDSQRQTGQTTDRAAVRERVRQSFIRNERTEKNSNR
jgi:hypothetical protein